MSVKVNRPITNFRHHPGKFTLRSVTDENVSKEDIHEYNYVVLYVSLNVTQPRNMEKKFKMPIFKNPTVQNDNFFSNFLLKYIKISC